MAANLEGTGTEEPEPATSIPACLVHHHIQGPWRLRLIAKHMSCLKVAASGAQALWFCRKACQDCQASAFKEKSEVQIFYLKSPKTLMSAIKGFFKIRTLCGADETCQRSKFNALIAADSQRNK